MNESVGKRDEVNRDVVEAVRYMQRSPLAQFEIPVPNWATFRAIMDVSCTYNHFCPERVAETMGELFGASMAVRVGQCVGAVIEADFPYFPGQRIDSRQAAIGTKYTVEEQIALARRWLEWGREVGVDGPRVVQAGRPGERVLVPRAPGKDPIGVRMWWD